MTKARKPARKRNMSTEEFLEWFWSQGEKRAAPYPELQGDCLLWVGAPTNHGYGQIVRFRKQLLVHKLAWEIHHGREVHSGMVVEHLCEGIDGQKMCYNPLHLRESSYAENMRTALATQRIPRGSSRGHAILTEADIPVIRRLHDEGWSNCAIGRRYEVHGAAISNIILGKNWTHVP